METVPLILKILDNMTGLFLVFLVQTGKFVLSYLNFVRLS